MFVADCQPQTAARIEDSAPSSARASSAGTSLQLAEALGAARSPLEAFIAARYAEVYGAQLRGFMPRLFSLHQHGQLIAAFGLRDAAEAPLFLERYLDEPVQAWISRQAGRPQGREHIAEIGNLAGATPGALRSLIPELTRLLHREGFHWLVFTGSAKLCRSFSKLGLPLSVVAPASPERLSAEERVRWGTYYDTAPAVMLGDVLLGERELRASARDPRELRARLAPVAGVGAP